MQWLRKTILMLMILALTSGTVIALDEQTKSNDGPVLNHGRKWQVGFCQSESYVDYATTFYYILKGLEEAGWIGDLNGMPFKEGQDDTSQMWDWLATHNTGPYLQFVKDAYYDLKKMTESTDAAKEARIIRRLNGVRDIDLMIITGTAAGLVLAHPNNQVPSLVFSTSDPIGSGIIKSVNDSGKDNLWAHVDLGQFRRQVLVFHDIFKFRKMGLVCEDSDLARSYIGWNDIKQVAWERGFDVITQHVPEPVNDSERNRYYRQTMYAYNRLAKEVDAMLLTVSTVPPEMLPQMLKPFYERKIPVFSQSGSLEVEHGALMSITLNDFPNLKRFAADTIDKVLRGVKPRRLPQVFESTPRILLNLKAAKEIGYKPNFEILLVADEIYR